MAAGRKLQRTKTLQRIVSVMGLALSTLSKHPETRLAGQWHLKGLFSLGTQ